MARKANESVTHIIPSPRQLKWQKLEFYALISYGMPPFTGKQYGDGFSPATMFWPEELDADSWAKLVKSAGMSAIVLTCKHYDGFCLWPTKQTDYSVKSSNWKEGEGDLVREVSNACKANGLKFGVYLAPWDRHEQSYGTGKAYDDFFVGLLQELLSDYGDVFCVWLDAVCGSDEKNLQDYDWERYYAVIRELQPDAVISFRGPDVRWSGNERGVARESEWSCIPAYLGVNEQGKQAGSCLGKELSLSSLDLGSRKVIKKEEEFIWYPAEISLPMRDHWFFTEDDKYSIKTKDKLLKLYYRSVGGNANLMLGLAPNKRGLFDDTDSQILTALGHDLMLNFGYNLLTQSDADIKASSHLGKLYSIDNVRSKNNACWRPAADDKKPTIEIILGEEDLFDKITICENIVNGQHVEEFDIEILNEKGKWKTVAQGTVIGYKKIVPLKPTQAKNIRIVFKKFREFIEILSISVN